ncbi:MAG: hypothetical protein ABGX04_13830 [Myxococcales bacterium]
MVVNHFRRLFYGSLQATSNGTLVEGVFRTPRWVGTIAVVIEIFMAFGLFLSLLGAIYSPQHGSWFNSAALALLLLVNPGMYFIGRKLGEPEEAEVLSYIRDELELSDSAV